MWFYSRDFDNYHALLGYEIGHLSCLMIFGMIIEIRIILLKHDLHPINLKVILTFHVLSTKYAFSIASIQQSEV